MLSHLHILSRRIASRRQSSLVSRFMLSMRKEESYLAKKTS
jgi:hypothetical protein